MRAIFPRRLRIDSKNDLISFELTSEWVDCVSRYIIGIAAFLSGDDEYAEKLFLDLLNNTNLKKINFPPLKKMSQRVPVRLADIYVLHATREFELWRKDRKVDHWNYIWSWIKKVKRLYPNQYNTRIFTAIYYFVTERNITKAIREIKKCQGQFDTTWRYSYAFLLAYRGELKKAIRIYKQAGQGYCDPSIPFQTEEFILWVLESEPEKKQLYFCLGMINWKCKEDRKQAIKDFTKFTEETSDDFMDKEKTLAEEYIRTIKNELKTKRSSLHT